MTDYEPGTVAVATVDGLPNVRVLRYERGWMFHNADWRQAWWNDESGKVTDVRPLVVLDPTDVAVEGLIAGWSSPWYAQEVRRQIEAQTKPPRIPEPGLWGVVAVNGRNYVRTSKYSWRSGDYVNKWDDIADGAVLVREGV